MLRYPINVGNVYKGINHVRQVLQNLFLKFLVQSKLMECIYPTVQPVQAATFIIRILETVRLNANKDANHAKLTTTSAWTATLDGFGVITHAFQPSLD